ncbi:MAG: N-acetylglucosamine-6-phosphate deacetylase [Planctomycetes bacterium]|nr:N-acetylglucosamine-6-phosphate deacetylase [Planctomycetota bacterium]
MSAAAPAGAACEAFGEAWIAPGFIDVHMHGLAGVAVEDIDEAGLRTVAAVLARHGVTAFLLSAVAAPAAWLCRTLEAVAGLPEVPGAVCLGIHLEGPFLDPAWAGAQDAGHCRPADRAEAERMERAAGGRLRSVTLAPEHDPELEVTRYFASRGVVVSLGHSAARHDVAVRAARAGATTVTHLFNAMPPFHHREPGLVGAALTEPGLVPELICDGVHLADAAVALAVRCRGARGCLLVSDAIPAAGLADGEHALGGRPVLVRGGVARTPEGRLAGSTLTLDRAVLNAARAAGIPLGEAARMAGEVPARVLGDRDRGRLEPGRRADITVFDETGVRLTLVGGRDVWRAGGGHGVGERRTGV